jgi:hypothetical protein
MDAINLFLAGFSIGISTAALIINLMIIKLRKK